MMHCFKDWFLKIWGELLLQQIKFLLLRSPGLLKCQVYVSSTLTSPCFLFVQLQSLLIFTEMEDCIDILHWSKLFTEHCGIFNATDVAAVANS